MLHRLKIIHNDGIEPGKREGKKVKEHGNYSGSDDSRFFRDEGGDNGGRKETNQSVNGN